MAKVKITETVLRDGHQSLLATRMRLSQMLPQLEALDAIGYKSLEAWVEVLVALWYLVALEPVAANHKVVLDFHPQSLKNTETSKQL